MALYLYLSYMLNKLFPFSVNLIPENGFLCDRWRVSNFSTNTQVFKSDCDSISCLYNGK